MIQAIVNKSCPAWYCKRCQDTSNILYIHGKMKYCEHCVPDIIKNQAVYMNQNREQIKINQKY